MTKVQKVEVPPGTTPPNPERRDRYFPFLVRPIGIFSVISYYETAVRVSRNKKALGTVTMQLWGTIRDANEAQALKDLGVKPAVTSLDDEKEVKRMVCGNDSECIRE